ncbi:GNAT family N-acetyltransferase [Mycolicibacterium smegmatis]|nr:GNAT family N-acetyltransferase [Mycolicibacterium smegmatis]AWT56160.1 hypothetical protein D806_052100 [Mycolicibacterium smegmatis MKD8]MCC3333765.1 GNAT family N-acetyltransferase [Mycolicibacterium smegmatis]MCO4192333.1 GNAT family N-acetyltransferase [Mycolicibacterium smegmatis]MCP2624833.1 GNAT family N-acetyltransferase [Mycolicibacterium smegmatis]MDF1898339.1 GNAT family N-acetyltransferase [Mycolicibacterium smegmatis]
MSINAVRTGHEPASYSVRLSSEVVEDALRLRHEALAGHGLPAPALDGDRFDEHCLHVLVRDDASGELVGSCRILPHDGATDAGGLYLATAFDVSALDPLRPAALEFSRAVIRPGHRNSRAALALWSGVLGYAEQHGYAHLVGSVPMPLHPAGEVRAMRNLLRREHAAPGRYTVRPYRPVVHDALHLPGHEPQCTLPEPLAAQVRLGARLCGDPAYDPEFGVAHFPMLQFLRPS